MVTQNSGSSVDTESVKTKRRGLFSKEADEGYVPNRELFAILRLSPGKISLISL